MTTPKNPAAPSARPRKPRAPRQNRPAQAATPAQTAQNDEVVQVTGPAVEEPLTGDGGPFRAIAYGEAPRDQVGLHDLDDVISDLGIDLEADLVEADAPAAGKDVPLGWYVFGHHADRPGVTVEFSKETDEDGAPLWERPIALPAVIDGVALDDREEVASPDPAHPYQRVVRTLLGPGFDAFLGESKES